MSKYKKVMLNNIKQRQLVAGSSVRFIHSKNMTQAFWEFEPDIEIKLHSHPHEQISNILEGVFELTIEGKSERHEAGSIVIIPANAKHSGRSVTACRILDVFTPVREDYL